jgi:hypothetical protein
VIRIAVVVRSPEENSYGLVGTGEQQTPGPT